MKRYTLLAILLASVLLITPNFSFGATSAEIQSQIQSIMAQIQALQQQIAQIYGSGSNLQAAIVNSTASVGPVAFWKLDNTGQTAMDSSGYNNTGTLQNGPIWTSGKEGDALSFDGFNDFVSVPNSSTLNITSNAMTISAWVNVAANSSYANWGIVSKRGWGSGYRLMINNANKASFSLTGQSGYAVTSANAITLGQWTHIAGVYDGSKMKIYINGVADPNEIIRSGSINSNTDRVTIGMGDSYSTCPSQNWWCYLYKGVIDNVKIYNRALTQSEILQEISAVSPPPPPPSPDIEAPTTNITFPSGGSNVSGAVSVLVSATDNIGVTKVELWKDGVLFGTNTVSPYSFSWDTIQTSNGSHSIQAKAYDAASNIGVSGVINVNVSNAPLTGPTEIIIDNNTTGTSKTGSWCVSGASGFYGTNSLYSCGLSTLDTYRWSPSLPGTTYDSYEVSMWWTSHVNRSTNVPIKILSNVGGIQTSSTKYVNEQINGGKWNSLGTFLLGSGSYVETNDSNGQAAADAVKFVKSVLSPPPSAPTISLSASPLSITSGQSSTLSWSSTNTTSCTASGAWSGTKAISGTQVVTPTVTSTYNLTCTGSGGSITRSITVTVSAVVTSPWPASDIHATTDSIAATIRTQLINQIWSGRGFPTRLANSVEVGVDPALLKPVSTLPNLASVDRYTIITNGNTVQPWVLRPITGNGQLAIIGLGHTLTGNLQNLTASTLLVSEALSRGNVVLIITMPNGGVDGHDLLGKNGTATFHPMEYFVSPSIVALNQYLSENSVPSKIVATGVSGGGWSTVLFSALDLRVVSSLPIAGSLPLDVRDPADTAVYGMADYGDWEQRLNNLTWNGTGSLDYLDLYLMAASNGRTQIQINNEFDTCCFYGTRHTAYAPQLTSTNPRWTFYLDQTPGMHGMGVDTLTNIIGPVFGILP